MLELMVERIDKNTTILKAIDLLNYVHQENSKEDSYGVDLFYTDDDGFEATIDLIKLNFVYWSEDEEEGGIYENDELSALCNKAFNDKDGYAHIEDIQKDIIQTLSTLKLGDASYIDIDICGVVVLEITFNVWEVKIDMNPSFDYDDLETAPNDKYVIIGRKFNNVTNAQLFKNAVKEWAKGK